MSSSTRFALTLAAVAAMPALAPADVTHSTYTDDENFHYHVNYMPDLDQKRSFLPANGNMFCVPTATMNMFAYAAEWGIDNLDPGPGVWQSDVAYGTLTGYLGVLGIEMDTGTDGTGPNGWTNGVEFWLDGDYPLFGMAWYKTEDWCPTLPDGVEIACNGALVSFVYGRYNFNPGPIPVVGSKESGHCVTLVHAKATNDDAYEIWSRDPADDGGDSLNQQSPWAWRQYTNVERKTIWQDWDDDSAYTQSDVTVFDYNPESDLIRFVDKLYVLYTLTGFSFSTVQINVQILNGGLDLSVEPPNVEFEFPTGQVIQDVVFNPNATGFMVLSQGNPNEPAHLVEINRLTGAQTLIAPIPHGRDLVVGRNRDIYVSTQTGQIVRIARRDGAWAVVDTYQWDFVPEALVYDDDEDLIYALSTVAHKLLVIKPDLGGPTTLNVPSTIPSTLTDICMSIDPNSGALWFVVPNSPQQAHGLQGIQTDIVALNLNGYVPPPGIQCVDFDDRGHMLVTLDTGKIDELKPDGNGGWVLVPNGRYAEVLANGPFRIGRSRSNFDPSQHLEDEIFTPVAKLPDAAGMTVFDCPGDLNNNGIVDGADLSLLLANFGQAGLGDLDADGVVTGADLGILLGAWGPCA